MSDQTDGSLLALVFSVRFSREQEKLNPDFYADGENANLLLAIAASVRDHFQVWNVDNRETAHVPVMIHLV